MHGFNPLEDEQPLATKYKVDKECSDLKNESRLPYHPVNANVNLARLRTTDIPENACVILSKALHPSLEAELQLRT